MPPLPHTSYKSKTLAWHALQLQLPERLRQGLCAWLACRQIAHCGGLFLV